MEGFANDWQRFNRSIAVNEEPAATATMIPKLQYDVAKPERNVPSINQRFIVLHPIASFCHIHTF